MKNKSTLFFSILLAMTLVGTGCQGVNMPGVVTVPAPAVTRIFPSATAPIQPAVQDTATPFSTDTPTAANSDTPTSTATASNTATSSPTATASGTPANTATTSASPSPLPSDTAEAVSLVGVQPQYTFSILMDYGKVKTMDVQEAIDYPNTSIDDLTNIVLAIEPNRIPGVFSLGNVSVNGTSINTYTLDGHKLTINLPTPLHFLKSVKLVVAFSLNLPAITQGDPNLIRPQIFGVTDRQVNVTDWYPMVIPYTTGQGWVLHNPWYYGEHLVYPLSNFDVTLRFKDPGSAPVVAASARGESVTGGTHYVLNNARDFVFSMGRQFKSEFVKVNGVFVTSYFYAGSGTAGKAAMTAAAKALQTYTDLFGPYPHDSLAVVQGDFNDGMEFDGLFFLSNAFYNLYDNTEKNYLVMIAAHETCHQWWFGRVANDQATEPWLDESLATYCEKIFYEKNYPASLNWWRGYRIDYYKPTGPIDGNVPSYGGFTPYTDSVYRRGALFLDELRQQIGDPIFFTFLKDYSLQMDGKISTSADFFRILRAHTQADLSGLLAKYFAHPPKF